MVSKGNPVTIGGGSRASLLILNFAIAFLGAWAGIQFYFWSATIQCGH